MSHQITKVDLIPNGELSVCNVSQFDNGRVLPFEITENKEAYTFPENVRVELHCRKADGNIVTLPSENITDNIVTFLSTTQLTACYGKNVCEIALYGPDDYLIGSGNFWLEVERDPLLGGLTSTSDIHNLEEQIEDITTEIVGENYYDKSEVDNKLALKANAADVYTKSQVDNALALKANAADVYTKSQVDNALALKANAADVYTKSQVDNALALKANAADVYTKGQVDTALALKANAADVYTKAETDAKIEDAIEEILPVDTAGPSAIASFTTGLALPLVDCKVDIVATGGNGTPDNPNPINGYSSANITANGDTVTIAFGQTVYGGVLDVTRGKLHVTWAEVDIGDVNWTYLGSLTIFYSALTNTKTTYNYDALCSCYPKSNDTSQDKVLGNTSYIGSGNNIWIKDSSFTDAATLKTTLRGQKIAYELATSFDIDLTPEVISAIVGVNNVYSDTNGDTTVKFKDTIQNYIDKKVST